MNIKEITKRLELILGCMIGSHTNNATPEHQIENLITELKAKNNEVLDLVSKRGDLDLSIENLVLKSTECNHKWERLDRNRIVCGECSEIQSRTL